MTISANLFVDVNPSVLPAGGSALQMNGICVTQNARVPIGTVPSFPTPTSVGGFFGAVSAEKAEADVYFKGFDTATKTPAAMRFAQYPQTAVAAWLRGGSMAATTLAQLQALTGSLTAVVDGYSHVIASISLASYNSFSAAAAAIQAAFTNPTTASFTATLGAAFTGSQTGTNLTTTAVTGIISVGDVIAGTGVAVGTTIVSQTSGPIGGAGVYVTSVAGTAAAAACTANSTVLNVTAVSAAGIAAGQTLVGAGVTGTPLITAFISGTTGGVGLYRINGAAQRVASVAMTTIATMPLVTYDSVTSAFVVTSGVTGAPSTAAFATGTLAIPLKLTAATGATLSQGSDAQTPGQFMDGIVNLTKNWASFFLMFDPDNGSGNAQKLLFSQWTNATGDRYAYVAQDADVTPTQAVPATTSLGYLLQQANLSGTNLNYDPAVGHYGAMISGWIASIDFGRTNGRIAFAFRKQSGIVASVTTDLAAINLGGNPQAIGDYGNGYNYYGAIATAADQFVDYQRGSVSGPWLWLDSYVNQIWMNNALQLAIMVFLEQINSFPYNPEGYALVDAVCQDPITAAINFGAIRKNVPLSSAQAAAVNNAAGVRISDILTAEGYFLQIKAASAPARQSRTSPPMTLWYMDGESIQAINLASIAVQ